MAGGSQGPPAFSSESKSHEKTKGRILQVAPTDDLLFRSFAYRGVCSRVDAEENRDRTILFHFNCRRRPHSRQGRVDRGHAAADQSFSEQTADLQRSLEDRYLPVAICCHSLSGASYRFLAADGRLCRRQSKVALGNHLASFLGYPDYSTRADCYVLHDARTGARDWEGKGAANILRPDAYPASLSDALMVEAKKKYLASPREAYRAIGRPSARFDAPANSLPVL